MNGVPQVQITIPGFTTESLCLGEGRAIGENAKGEDAKGFMFECRLESSGGS
jgi:hypothetical protein